MQLSRKTALPAALTALALSGLAVPAARAQTAPPVTLTLDNPNQTLVTPLYGDVPLQFFGTLTYAPGYHWDGATLTTPISLDNTSLNNTSMDITNLTAPNGGGTFHGLLFTVDVPAFTSPSYYGYWADVNGVAGPSFFKVDVRDAAYNNFTPAVANYSVTVLRATVVPEPSPLILLLLALPTLGAVTVRARRRRPVV